MLHSILNSLRRRGLDIQSGHRRDAANAETVVARLLRGRDVRTVFDCGAHHGRMARVYRGMFPGATVHCFEPTPATFATLETNLRGLDRIELVNAAVGDTNGTLDLSLSDDEQTNSLGRASTSGKRTPVRVLRMADYCSQRKIDRIDLVKIDVEGYELTAFKGLEPMLGEGRIGLIYSEVRFVPLAPGCTDFLELAGYLRQRGLIFYGMYDAIFDQNLRFDWGDALFAHESLIRP